MTCVIVLGVPRSGTSAVAGFLHKFLGVCMGEENRLMPPLDHVNPKGFFEDTEFVAKHIELLGSHEDPRMPEDGLLPCSDEVLDSYTQLIRIREKQHDLWGVKDPKMCFLLPYFLRRLRTPYKIIATERNFTATVESMKPLYGGMTLDQAITRAGRYRYAMKHHLQELTKTSRESWITVNYHNLMKIPEGFIFSVLDFLERDDSKYTSHDIKAMIKWFDPSMDHHPERLASVR